MSSNQSFIVTKIRFSLIATRISKSTLKIKRNIFIEFDQPYFLTISCSNSTQKPKTRIQATQPRQTKLEERLFEYQIFGYEVQS